MESSNSPAAGSTAATESQAEVTQPQAQSNEAAQPTAAEIRKMKLKIDGKDMELPEDEVIRYAQQGKAANQRFQEAAKMRKEAEELVALIKRDPRAVLEDPRIGHNFRQLAEQYLAEQLKLEMMSPEQRKIHQYEQQLRQIEAQKKEQQQTQEQAQMQKLQEHYAQDYSKRITDALSSGGVPKTARTVKRMAELMSKSLQHGLELQPSDLAKMVKEDYLTEMKEMFSQSDEDTLLGLLGDDTANKIRKADLKRLKGGALPTKTAQTAKQPEPPKKKMNPDEWSEWIKKQI